MPHEHFDTSVGVRSQAGDAVNLNTVSGVDGSLTGNVNNCGVPINMAQPDNAWTWVDSQDQIGSASMADGYSMSTEHATDGIKLMRDPLTIGEFRQWSNNNNIAGMNAYVAYYLSLPATSASKTVDSQARQIMYIKQNKNMMNSLNKYIQAFIASGINKSIGISIRALDLYKEGLTPGFWPYFNGTRGRGNDVSGPQRLSGGPGEAATSSRFHEGMARERYTGCGNAATKSDQYLSLIQAGGQC